jgi:hypothetical protein
MVISYIYSICWHMKSTFYERQHRALYLKHMDANLVGALWVLQGTREAGTLPVGPGAMVQGCQN